MRELKFLTNPLIKAHDGGYINAGEYFYSMNKEEMPSVCNPRNPIAKYTIVRRRIDPSFKNHFKPDYDALWYFRSKESAEYLKRIWMREDEGNNNGLIGIF